MPNINDLISQMPSMVRPPKQTTPADQASLIVNQSIPAILQFISRELPIKKDFETSQALQKKLSELMDSLVTLVESADTKRFSEDIQASIEVLAEKVGKPEINVTIATDAIKAVEKAVRNISFEPTDTKPVVMAINSLVPVLRDLATCVEENKVEEVKLDVKSMKLLKNLEMLDTDAKNPIAVRLSDGKEFYKVLNNLNGGITAMTGSSGNNFLTPSGNPTKANLDADGNLLVATGVSSVSAAVTSVSGSASSVTLLAATTRKGFIIFNDSSAILYIKLGATASTSSFTYRLTPYGVVTETSLPYGGVIDGIWASATGAARITELT